ncbi:DUF4012 domain-containing protein [Egicoccus halophilus]|uniref:DUF4012 domain-containing protein n=1 Tax=Egicoccus halophilus TaxID=1670830 RepID=A0A8J3A7D4_9ACTN|nr:DUF4012 domain-containing protein [Egicoccus halophilus]GGI05458.1 hypothetical protein GCM10011354_14200 [Egicoccus halophilus]
MSDHDTLARPQPSPSDPRSGGRSRWLWLGALVVVAGWLLLAGMLLFDAQGHLRAAQGELPGAVAALAASDLDTARATLAAAEADLTAAADRLRSPAVVPLRFVPVFGRDLRAVTAVADGGERVTVAAGELAEALAGLTAPPTTAASTGGLPVAAVQGLADPMNSTARTLRAALTDIEAAVDSGRVRQVSEGRRQVLELLEPATTSAETAAALTATLPAFLGNDGERHYLVGASTPAALGGTGGFVGSTAALRVTDGELTFGRFEPADEFPVLPADQLPAPVAEDAQRWSRYGGTGDFLTLNRSAHFPAAARAMVQHWETTHDQQLDGMIVVDPFALRALLALSGPAPVPGTEFVLDADNVVDFVANEAYEELGFGAERKELLGAVAAMTLQRFLVTGAGMQDPTALASAMTELAARGHLLLYSEHDDEQQAFARTPVAGALADPPGELVNVVANNGTATKIDFFGRRELELDVDLLESGTSATRMRLTIVNDAPSEGYPRHIIGPNNPTLDAGDNLLDLSVYLATAARFVETPAGEPSLPAFEETELGHPVHDHWVRIPSGTSVSREYAWQTDHAHTETDDGEVVYRLLLQGQTVLQPTEVTVRMAVPDGFTVVDLPPDAEDLGDTVQLSTDNQGEDLRFEVRLRPAG